MIKRYILCIILFLFCFSGMACSNDEAAYEYTDYSSLYEQLISQRPKGNMFEGELNYSDDFSHIEIYTEKSLYKSTDNVIKCRIINHLAGNGFWFCYNGFIEKEINGRWDNEPLTDEYLDQIQWFFCAVPAMPDSEFSTLSILYTESLKNKKLTAGNYRFVVLVEDKILRTEFTVE